MATPAQGLHLVQAGINTPFVEELPFLSSLEMAME